MTTLLAMQLYRRGDAHRNGASASPTRRPNRHGAERIPIPQPREWLQAAAIFSTARTVKELGLPDAARHGCVRGGSSAGATRRRRLRVTILEPCDRAGQQRRSGGNTGLLTPLECGAPGHRCWRACGRCRDSRAGILHPGGCAELLRFLVSSDAGHPLAPRHAQGAAATLSASRGHLRKIFRGTAEASRGGREH